MGREEMKEYGLANVHQEAWELPEGWLRGVAEARVIEPDTGVRLAARLLRLVSRHQGQGASSRRGPECGIGEGLGQI